MDTTQSLQTVGLYPQETIFVEERWHKCPEKKLCNIFIPPLPPKKANVARPL